MFSDKKISYTLNYGTKEMKVEHYASTRWQYGLLQWNLAPVRWLLRILSGSRPWRVLIDKYAPRDSYRKLFS